MLRAGKHVIQGIFRLLLLYLSYVRHTIWWAKKNLLLNQLVKWHYHVTMPCVMISIVNLFWALAENYHFEPAFVERGFILDMGVHFIAGLRMIVGSEISMVSAIARHVDTTLPPPDNICALFQLENGCGGVFVMAVNLISPKIYWHIDGTKGTLQIERGNKNGHHGYSDGNEVFFRIKRSTQLKKLMNAYCDRQSVDFSSIAFLFDGRRLRGEQTPEELEMEEGDEIDAMLHQTGGSLLT